MISESGSERLRVARFKKVATGFQSSLYQPAAAEKPLKAHIDYTSATDQLLRCLLGLAMVVLSRQT